MVLLPVTPLQLLVPSIINIAERVLESLRSQGFNYKILPRETTIEIVALRLMVLVHDTPSQPCVLVSSIINISETVLEILKSQGFFNQIESVEITKNLTLRVVVLVHDIYLYSSLYILTKYHQYIWKSVGVITITVFRLQDTVIGCSSKTWHLEL